MALWVDWAAEQPSVNGQVLSEVASVKCELREYLNVVCGREQLVRAKNDCIWPLPRVACGVPVVPRDHKYDV